MALANITIKILAKIGATKYEKSISVSDKISPSKINTSEFDTNAKKSQNFTTDSSTFGLILYRP